MRETFVLPVHMMCGARPGLMRVWPLYNVYANMVQGSSLGPIICFWLFYSGSEIGMTVGW